VIVATSITTRRTLRERREQPQREQHAAASFGEACQRRMAATGMKPSVSMN